MGVLVGRQAPDFSATAVKSGAFIENFKLSDVRGKYVFLLFYTLYF
jgi:peroxiredoxin (alkyl hydroperoxide reductase subunit C)